MPTEAADPRYREIDRWPTEAAVEAMLESQLAAIAALKSQAGAMAAAIDAAAERLRHGGRIAYAGAGTSGRIGVQDGVELTPTFNWPVERLAFLIAGGPAALTRTQEGAEDSREAALAAVVAEEIGANDVLIGVAASGRTPYVVAALEAARGAGALTIALANNAGTPVLAAAEHAILADTGSEVVAGSTRMKAGTAQKVALNLLSTGIMLRLGLVHEGLMVNMQVSNAKLRARAIRMVGALADVDGPAAETALDAGGRDIKRAVLIARGLAPAEAEARLAAARGSLGAVLDVLP
ncbi:MAG: N-acetylmuramic acid 6-phosphate etherase [Sphingomonas sp.]|uniref:N-acetylmuramic acid 6-phosphate etherase n=1 Tax=unclassified Sphingomonas TaxID=196159 RepID=UPI0024585C7C|nr:MULTISPECIES: N-acetylmuramic acid 6-phosphate etherase [unclassified Sphingomonas]MBQ1497326.1 N-acetylmuramic acid 6-phosphate etherase [Sphingomonas sp.]MDH4742965.1 N-acetylmuramic acid 6-phosphate etherase [Sphingomonas sp. CBMAI 2297]